MNTLSILIVLPLLVVFSYIFDAIARKTKFPSVILLMFTGIIVRIGTNLYGFTEFKFLDQLIPVLGTVGLILIVLEGASRIRHQKRKASCYLERVLCCCFHFDFKYYCCVMGSGKLTQHGTQNSCNFCNSPSNN